MMIQLLASLNQKHYHIHWPLRLLILISIAKVFMLVTLNCNTYHSTLESIIISRYYIERNNLKIIH